MKRRPRSPDEPVIAPALGVRLGFAGLLIAIGTLVVVAWAEDRYGLAVATTMGLTTISLLHIVAALEWRDPIRSVFNRDTIANGRFNLLMLAALALTFLATTDRRPAAHPRHRRARRRPVAGVPHRRDRLPRPGRARQGRSLAHGVDRRRAR